MRESFRLPLEVWIENPALLRLYAQQLLQPTSPLGELSRQLRAEICGDLAADWVRFGCPARSKRERERVAMIAEAMLAQIEALAVGLVDGRFERVETAVDVLTSFATSLLASTNEAPSA